MRPSRVSRPPGENGPWAEATDFAAATFFTAASTRARVAASRRVPWRARKTIWSVSPLAAGKCSARRSYARWLSVPGRRKLEICLTPTADAATWMRIRAASQAKNVRQRWRLQRRARRTKREAERGLSVMGRGAGVEGGDISCSAPTPAVCEIHRSDVEAHDPAADEEGHVQAAVRPDRRAERVVLDRRAPED